MHQFCVSHPFRQSSDEMILPTAQRRGSVALQIKITIVDSGGL
jgi:hypothetical protein